MILKYLYFNIVFRMIKLWKKGLLKKLLLRERETLKKKYFFI